MGNKWFFLFYGFTALASISMEMATGSFLAGLATFSGLLAIHAAIKTATMK